MFDDDAALSGRAQDFVFLLPLLPLLPLPTLPTLPPLRPIAIAASCFM